MKIKQLILNITNIVLITTSITACHSGNLNQNTATLSVMPWQYLGESVISCQHELMEHQAVKQYSDLLNVTSINSNGIMSINAYKTIPFWGCQMYPYLTNTHSFNALQVESSWEYNPVLDDGSIVNVSNPQRAIIKGISDNNITIGNFLPSGQDSFAAVGNNLYFKQLPLNGSYFDLNNQNSYINNISSNGVYAIGEKISYYSSAHFDGGITYSYIYDPKINQYNFSINTDQYNMPYSKNNPALKQINNNGISVGELKTNDSPLSTVGVYCSESASCKTILPDFNIQHNIIESMFQFYHVNNNGIMLGEETVFYLLNENIEYSNRVKFYNDNTLLKTLSEQYQALPGITLTDDNVTLIMNVNTGIPYLYSYNTDQYVELGVFMNKATGWDDNTAFNNDINMSGFSQDGHYVYGSTNIASSSGILRVPYTIYFKNGLANYLNSINTESTSNYKHTNNLKQVYPYNVIR